MKPFPKILAAALLLSTAAAQAATLPDTGQSTCYNNTLADTVDAFSVSSVSSDAQTHPRQDCRYGRDPAAAAGASPKIGSGVKGFDYTKIANNGGGLEPSGLLGAAPTDWACTRDNVTGLTWEIKTSGPGSLRFSGHTYTWYNPDDASNGGFEGYRGGGTCAGTLPGNFCNTRAYLDAVNGTAMCSYTDWRLPTLRELRTLVNADGSIPAIDATLFPGAVPTPSWTAVPQASDVSNAWYVDFADGEGNVEDKSRSNAIRLVRGVAF